MTSENTVRDYCFGIDVGSNKIVIGQNLFSKHVPSPEILGDFMDIRKIPNVLALPHDAHTERTFGNSVASSKACNFSQMNDDPEVTYPFTIHGKSYLLPIFYVRNMIMSYIKNIIRFRIGSDDYSSVKTLAYVPKFSHIDNPKFIMAEMLGINICLSTDLPQKECDILVNTDSDDDIDDAQTYNNISNVNIVPINDVNALVLAYVQKYVMNDGYRSNCTGQVLIIDIGYSKSQVIKFKVEKNNHNMIIIEQLAYAIENIGCEHIDNAFSDYVMQKIRKDHPMFNCKTSSFADQIIKLKHQLSTNQKISTWIQGTDTDVPLIIMRDELNNVISSLKFKDILMKMFDNGVGFVEAHNDTVNQRHIEVVGGGARMPYVIDIIKEYCDNKGSMKIGRALNPDEAVAEGASMYSWLYNNSNSSNLIFYRYVKQNIHIEYSSNTNSYRYENTPVIKRVFSESEKLLTMFNDDTSFSNSEVNSIKSDVTKLYVDAKGGKFIIHIGNSLKNYFTIKMLDLPKEAEYVDVYIRYTLADTVYITIKYADNIINYEMEAVFNDNVINLNKWFTEYQHLEENLLCEDDDIAQKHILTNYLEDYFNRKDDINSLICKVQNVDNIPDNEKIFSVDDDISQRLAPLHTPVKELYEFYNFCQAYMYCDDDTSSDINQNLKRKHDYILSMLNDKFAVSKLIEATVILKNIKTKYNK